MDEFLEAEFGYYIRFGYGQNGESEKLAYHCADDQCGIQIATPAYGYDPFQDYQYEFGKPRYPAL